MTTRRDLIVIGASLGGPAALCTLGRALPAPFPAAVLVAQHTAPNGPMLLADMLARCTALAVSYGRQADDIRPGHIYLAPPDRHLVVARLGVLGLDDGPKVRHARPAADPLFRSAAAFYGPRVIGVVLTGGDGDGTEGLRAIAAAGGIGVVQDPAEARDPAMPRSALDGADPEHCASIEEIGVLLAGLVHR